MGKYTGSKPLSFSGVFCRHSAEVCTDKLGIVLHGSLYANVKINDLLLNPQLFRNWSCILLSLHLYNIITGLVIVFTLSIGMGKTFDNIGRAPLPKSLWPDNFHESCGSCNPWPGTWRLCGKKQCVNAENVNIFINNKCHS